MILEFLIFCITDIGFDCSFSVELFNFCYWSWFSQHLKVLLLKNWYLRRNKADFNWKIQNSFSHGSAHIEFSYWIFSATKQAWKLKIVTKDSLARSKTIFHKETDNFFIKTRKNQLKNFPPKTQTKKWSEVKQKRT